MAVKSGIGAVIHTDGSAESTVRRWLVRYRSLANKYAATNTSGGYTQGTGNLDWQGHYLGYGHTPSVFPGDSFDFQGTTDGTQGVYGTARCKRLAIVCDIERGTQISYRVDFAANGALALAADVSDMAGSAAVPLTDTSAVNDFTSVARKINLGGDTLTDSGTPIPQCRLWQLVFFADNRPLVHTGTSGQVERTAGTVGAQWLYQAYVDSPEDTEQIPAMHSMQLMKFYVTDTTFWQLTWGRVLAVDPFTANREGVENAGVTVGGELCAYNAALGSIYNPALTQKWPAA